MLPSSHYRIQVWLFSVSLFVHFIKVPPSGVVRFTPEAREDPSNNRFLVYANSSHFLAEWARDEVNVA